MLTKIRLSQKFPFPDVIPVISHVKALNLTTATVRALGFMMRVVKTAAILRLEDAIPIPEILLIPGATMIMAIILIPATEAIMVILTALQNAHLENTNATVLTHTIVLTDIGIRVNTAPMVVIHQPENAKTIPALLNAHPENTNATVIIHTIVPTDIGIQGNTAPMAAIHQLENATRMIQVAHQEIPNAKVLQYIPAAVMASGNLKKLANTDVVIQLQLRNAMQQSALPKSENVVTIKSIFATMVFGKLKNLAHTVVIHQP